MRRRHQNAQWLLEPLGVIMPFAEQPDALPPRSCEILETHRFAGPVAPAPPVPYHTKGSGVVFGENTFHMVDPCPKTTPDPLRLRSWFAWIVRERLLEQSPAVRMQLPREEKRLPRHALSLSGVVLTQPDIGHLRPARPRGSFFLFPSPVLMSSAHIAVRSSRSIRAATVRT